MTQWNIEKGLDELKAIEGVKYQHQGRSIEDGFDCAGVVFHALEYAGWKPLFPQTTFTLDYTPEGSWSDIKKVLETEGYEITKEDALPLDMVIIQWVGKNIPQHFAVISHVNENGIYITHTHQSFDKVATNRITAPLERRIYCYFRFYGRVDNDPLDPRNQGA